MEQLTFFAFWGAAIFLMMRFGCGAHVMRRRRGASAGQSSGGPQANTDLRWIAPQRDADPVCDKTIATAGAKSSVFDGRVFYFCSRECREVFEASPDAYVDKHQRHNNRQLEHSHVGN